MADARVSKLPLCQSWSYLHWLPTDNATAEEASVGDPSSTDTGGGVGGWKKEKTAKQTARQKISSSPAAWVTIAAGVL